MENKLRPLSALFIFSDRDRQYKRDMEPFFRLLNSFHRINDIDFMEIDELNFSHLPEELEKKDLFIFLMTLDLLTHEFFQSAAFKRMLRFHRLKRLSVVPILVKECRIDEKLFKGISILPENGHPIIGKYWENTNDAYLHIFDSLQVISHSMQLSEKDLEEAWTEAQEKDSVDSYQEFLEIYPYSRFSREAKVRKDYLVDDLLWNKASENNSVSGFFDYLTEGPLQRRRLEAVGRIHLLEEDEERYYSDAVSSQRMELFVRYKYKYPKGKNLYNANLFIEDELKRPTPLPVNEDLASDCNFLMLKAYKELNYSEIFSLTTFLDRFLQMRNNMLKGIKRLNNDRFTYMGYFLIFFAFELFAYLWDSRVREPVGDTPYPFGMSLLVFILLIVFNGFLINRMIICYKYISRDISFFQKASQFVRVHTTLLKISFINHDMEAIKNHVKLLRKVEKEGSIIIEKTMLVYLLPEEHQVDMDEKNRKLLLDTV